MFSVSVGKKNILYVSNPFAIDEIRKTNKSIHNLSVFCPDIFRENGNSFDLKSQYSMFVLISRTFGRIDRPNFKKRPDLWEIFTINP